MKKTIGYVGVDSGQILICDPCYIDSNWQKEEFNILRRYKHNDGSVLQYERDFPNFGIVIPKYGKTMNQIIDDNEATEIPDDVPAQYDFSYNACCKKTCTPVGMGELGYHDELGVAVGNFGGDGSYPVIADIDDNGLVKSITIKFNY
jgi:hypothetical protein